MKSKALELIYQDTKIHFLVSNDENVMINATDMAKIFGKRPNDFLILDSTQNYIKSFLCYGISCNMTLKDIYIVKSKVATFMNRPLALKFAAWLDSDFEVWVYNTIDKLLFDNYKLHNNKTILMQQKMNDLENLKKSIIANQNPEAIKLLELHQEIKTLNRQKNTAIRNQVAQIKLELNF